MKIKNLILCTLILGLVTGCTEKTQVQKTKGTESFQKETIKEKETKTEEQTEKETEIEKEYYFVSYDYVNIRKGASISSDLVGKLYRNEIFAALPSDENGWVIKEDGNYVSSDYVKKIDESTEELIDYQLEERFEEDTVYGMIYDTSGNIRDLPDTSKGKILVNKSHGMIYSILGTCNKDWFLIKYDENKTGYISSEVFKSLTKEEYETYTTLPQKRDFDVKQSELVGSYTTNYAPVATNRGFNVEKGANEIDSLVILPGATFNWCRDMGPCGEAEGYKSSNEISGGKYVTGYGGGICQISSTLCGAVLTSDMDFDIIERHQHSKAQAYIPRDLDATVSYPNTNLIFKNSNDFPVMIKTHYENGNITVELYKLNV